MKTVGSFEPAGRLGSFEPPIQLGSSSGIDGSSGRVHACKIRPGLVRQGIFCELIQNPVGCQDTSRRERDGQPIGAYRRYGVSAKSAEIGMPSTNLIARASPFPAAGWKDRKSTRL